MRLSAVLLLAVLLGGCELVGGAGEGLDLEEIETIRFSRHVQPLLADRCGACHAGEDAAAGLRLDAWAHLVEGSAFGEAVVPFDADRSPLVRMVRDLAGGPHPAELDAEPLTDDEVAFLARWIDEGARDDAGRVPLAGDRPRLYVTNQDAALVTVVDMEAHVVARTVDLRELGFSATARPHHVAVEPDGSHWYVSLIGEDRVLKFDRENRLVGEAVLEKPGLLAVHPERDLLLVGRSMTAVDPPESVALVRRSDMTVREVPVVFPRPHALAVSPDGGHVYTASLAENRLMAVDLATEDVAFTPVGGGPQVFVQYAVRPGAAEMYVTAEHSGALHRIDLSDPARPAVAATFAAGARPWHPVFSPDGATLYVPLKGEDAVAVFDAAAGRFTGRIEGDGLAEPHGGALGPEGRYLYVSNNNLDGRYAPRHDFADPDPPGTVAVIDTGTGEVVKVLEVAPNPTGIAEFGRPNAD